MSSLTAPSEDSREVNSRRIDGGVDYSIHRDHDRDECQVSFKDVHFTMDVFSALEFSRVFRSRVSNLLPQEAFDLL